MEQQLRKRSDIDFMRRSLPGVLFYSVMWPMMAWSTGFYQQAPIFNTIFSALFAFISLMRITHAYATDFLYKSHYGFWRVCLFILPLCQGITLSTLMVIMILHEPFQKMAVIVLLLVTGIVSGSAISLSPKPLFTQFYIGLLIAPGFVAAGLTEEFKFLMPLGLVLWVYFGFSTHRFYRDYKNAFETEQDLIENQNRLKVDPLTDIYNRQYFDIVLAMQWSLMARSRSYLSVLFLDVDHFKSVNDHYGHLAGDQALCHVAKLFEGHARRQADICARYGGEEFAIILPHTTMEDAQVIAEAIRHHLENEPVKYGTHVIPLTVSIGINSVMPSDTIPMKQLLDHADQALYKAKETGRNKVVCYEPDMSNQSDKSSGEADT